MDAESYKKADMAVRVAAIKTFTAIIKETPVDEGRARSNWFIDMKPTNKTSERKETTNPAQEIPQILLGKKIYLYNNLPYIGVLEFGGYVKNPKRGTWNKKTNRYEIRSIKGYSKLAPSGMVRKNTNKWSKTLTAALRQVFK